MILVSLYMAVNEGCCGSVIQRAKNFVPTFCENYISLFCLFLHRVRKGLSTNELFFHWQGQQALVPRVESDRYLLTKCFFFLIWWKKMLGRLFNIGRDSSFLFHGFKEICIRVKPQALIYFRSGKIKSFFFCMSIFWMYNVSCNVWSFYALNSQEIVS